MVLYNTIKRHPETLPEVVLHDDKVRLQAHRQEARDAGVHQASQQANLRQSRPPRPFYLCTAPSARQCTGRQSPAKQCRTAFPCHHRPWPFVRARCHLLQCRQRLVTRQQQETWPFPCKRCRALHTQMTPYSTHGVSIESRAQLAAEAGVHHLTAHLQGLMEVELGGIST